MANFSNREEKTFKSMCILKAKIIPVAMLRDRRE
jgi:hypothetical protein